MLVGKNFSQKLEIAEYFEKSTPCGAKNFVDQWYYPVPSLVEFEFESPSSLHNKIVEITCLAQFFNGSGRCPRYPRLIHNTPSWAGLEIEKMSNRNSFIMLTWAEPGFHQIPLFKNHPFISWFNFPHAKGIIKIIIIIVINK